MSGIYIPGERIPDTLTAFWIFPSGYVRVFGKNGDEIRGREAVPVPDHGDLIDKDALRKEVNRICDKYDAGVISEITCLNMLLVAFLGADTIIPAYPAKEGET